MWQDPCKARPTPAHLCEELERRETGRKSAKGGFVGAVSASERSCQFVLTVD